MMSPVTYRLERPDGAHLKLRATGDGRVIFITTMTTCGRTPRQLASACHKAATDNLTLSRRAVVEAEWPFEVNPDAALWQRFRDVIAQMPRGPSSGGDEHDQR